jgi:hypothetical protein
MKYIVTLTMNPAIRSCKSGWAAPQKNWGCCYFLGAVVVTATKKVTARAVNVNVPGGNKVHIPPLFLHSVFFRTIRVSA